MEPQQPSGRNQNGRAHATVRLADVDVLSSSVERVDIRASGDERRGVGAHAVQIRTQVGRQELWIDGLYQPYFVGPDGYTLQAHVYAPPSERSSPPPRHISPISNQRKSLDRADYRERRLIPRLATTSTSRVLPACEKTSSI